MKWPCTPSAFAADFAAEFEPLVVGGDRREAILAPELAAYRAALAVVAAEHPGGAGVGSPVAAMDELVMVLSSVAFTAGVRFGAAGEVLRRTLTSRTLDPRRPR